MTGNLVGPALLTTVIIAIGNTAQAQSYACNPLIECPVILDGCEETGYQDQINIIEFSDEKLVYNDEMFGPIEAPVIATTSLPNHKSYFFAFDEISLMASLYDDGTLIVFAANARDTGSAGVATFSCEAVQ